MEKSDILASAKAFVKTIFTENIPGEYLYHNYDHTKRVVRNTAKIAEGSGLSEKETEIALLAAYFHDSGFSVRYKDNEKDGAEIAETFLKKSGYPDEKIALVKEAVLATAMPQNPKNIISMVLCDADLANLGKKYFFEVNELIRLEYGFVKGKDVDREEWCRQTLKLMETHRYHTDFANETLGPRKLKNHKKLKERLAGGDVNNIDPIKEMQKKKDKKKNKEKKPGVFTPPVTKSKEDLVQEFLNKPPSRGIETMFRNNLRGHLELSGLADNKANIMLSINAVVLSIIVSVMIPEVTRTPVLGLPTLILVLTCVTTIVFATISTRPKVTSGTFKKEDIRNKTANLLFFGNFHNMNIDDFQWGMTEMMKDKEFLYGSMIRDFYYLGLVLNKKYRYLRFTYSIFMFGIVISAIAYIITFVFMHSQNPL